MAVTWEVVGNPDLIALHEQDTQEWRKTEALLSLGWTYGLMHIIGLGSITDTNKGEFFARLSALQGLTIDAGGLVTMWDGEKTVPMTFTREDIYKRVGLTTNYTNMNRSQWLKDRFMVFFDDTIGKE